MFPCLFLDKKLIPTKSLFLKKTQNHVPQKLVQQKMVPKKKLVPPKLVSKKDVFPQKRVSNLLFLEKFVPPKLVSEKTSFPKSLFLTKAFFPPKPVSKKKLVPQNLVFTLFNAGFETKGLFLTKLLPQRHVPPKACFKKNGS